MIRLILNLGQNKKETVLIYRNDNPTEIIENLCSQHGIVCGIMGLDISGKEREKLETAIWVNLKAVMNKM